MAYRKKTKKCTCCKRSRRDDVAPFVGGMLIGGATAYALTRGGD